MGKGKRDKKLSAVATKSDDTKPTPIEVLMRHIVSEYTQTTMVPAGNMTTVPRTGSDGIEYVGLQALCQFQGGCPNNFADFLFSASIREKEAYPWYCRSRIRYSCSNLTTVFLYYVVPQLKSDYGIVELWSSTLKRNIPLDNLEIQTVLFFCNKQHAFNLERPIMPAHIDVVEALSGHPPHCNHNALKCRDTGVIIDLSLGQFTGCMLPMVFANEDEFEAAVPGEVVQIFPCPQKDIDEQIKRDNSAFRARISSDCLPAKFTKRVFRSWSENKLFCGHCLGIASARCTMKRCSRCHEVTYCSKSCQSMHWKKGHKLEFQLKNAS